MGLGRAPQHPRVRHLHIIVDDLPSWWADASHNNTVEIAGQQPGQHSVTIALFDANHNPFPGQVVTVTFTVPSSAAKQHTHMQRGSRADRNDILGRTSSRSMATWPAAFLTS